MTSKAGCYLPNKSVATICNSFWLLMSREERISLYKVLNCCQISPVPALVCLVVTCGRGARYSGVMYLSAPSPLVMTPDSTVSSSTVISSSTCHLQHYRLQPPLRVRRSGGHYYWLLCSHWVIVTDWTLSVMVVVSQVLSAKFWQQLARLCTGDFTLECTHSTVQTHSTLGCQAVTTSLTPTLQQYLTNYYSLGNILIKLSPGPWHHMSWLLITEI